MITFLWIYLAISAWIHAILHVAAVSKEEGFKNTNIELLVLGFFSVFLVPLTNVKNLLTLLSPKRKK